ncbi:hypothetical protein DB347_20375 [Opitutaceae bacterium EW11]|nr:hypothetical protein DB347_20375 [Opitutaceae bacterium EW11]
MRRTRTDKRQLQESCAWLRVHWNPTNLDVPEHLREQWMYEADGDHANPEGFQLAVFTFGFMQHDVVSNQVPAGEKRSYSGNRLLALFSRWQLKLALAEVHSRTHLRTKPLPLFDFADDEQVEVWPEGDPATDPCG